MTIELKALSEDWFRRYPVWTWAEDEDREDLLTPVDIVGGILPSDCSQLLVRARVSTVGGRQFEGFVCWGFGVYAISFYIQGESFGFNKNLGDFVDQELDQIRRIAGIDSGEPIFPLSFETEFKSEEGAQVSGVFEMP